MEKEFSKLLNIISEISGENKETIKKSDKLIVDMDFDSLMMIDLIQTIEFEYGLSEKSIDYKELSEEITVGEAWSIIQKELGINVSKYEKNVSSINSFPEIIKFDEIQKKYGDKVPYFIRMKECLLII